MATFAILVQFDIPDDVQFETAAVPMIEALRTLAPVQPTLVTAFAGDTAERVIHAGKGNLPEKD